MMTTEQLLLVGYELHQAGFSVRSTLADGFILVALNRGISTSEVREALEQVFGEIQFSIEYWYGKVKVS
jgi:hypothetical protein